MDAIGKNSFLQYDPNLSSRLVQFEIVAPIALFIDVVEDASVWTLAQFAREMSAGSVYREESSRAPDSPSQFA
jgi:hypothetical protein